MLKATYTYGLRRQPGLNISLIPAAEALAGMLRDTLVGSFAIGWEE